MKKAVKRMEEQGHQTLDSTNEGLKEEELDLEEEQQVQKEA